MTYTEEMRKGLGRAERCELRAANNKGLTTIHSIPLPYFFNKFFHSPADGRRGRLVVVYQH
jgi:hypothetical protein